MSIARRNCIFGKRILRRSIVEIVSLVSATVGRERNFKSSSAEALIGDNKNCNQQINANQMKCWFLRRGENRSTRVPLFRVF